MALAAVLIIDVCWTYDWCSTCALALAFQARLRVSNDGLPAPPALRSAAMRCGALAASLCALS